MQKSYISEKVTLMNSNRVKVLYDTVLNEYQG